MNYLSLVARRSAASPSLSQIICIGVRLEPCANVDFHFLPLHWRVMKMGAEFNLHFCRLLGSFKTPCRPNVLPEESRILWCGSLSSPPRSFGFSLLSPIPKSSARVSVRLSCASFRLYLSVSWRQILLFRFCFFYTHLCILTLIFIILFVFLLCSSVLSIFQLLCVSCVICILT